VSQREPKTVLIVEDDVDIRETLRDAFEDEGYAVRCAANGSEGLDALRNFELPSVIVLDLMMPMMDGTELYAEMQADRTLASIPVVVSTSDPSRAPSGVLIMKKPIDLARLLSTVAKLC
jgi:CheY-like chemotaxis protein